ncbi:hypothetical protein CNMCM8980_005862 [Aspergillus fumigatiaffinis]|jgi:hypothetical protein|uniref:Small secreted protein n=1 Tax=Aspergillus fumigatiaffinis TaxID=340414 RepID=A0A8H4GY67_9EURO|nr:hypothetical protein CNMCM5878_007570 [Aspergillus fumigatiaffinis]KAF4231190.1 hypothetical protein CNMCM6457_005591 [Aspergillus fumigatiaffinis]KAF4244463.1 hypothetical protein CNMCM6805_008715 [Aspergillus fumigatiaffinis]KAF4248498.1 hypothetical protein CNMCM8980_005862 [Aspergillus fumigatiaffinis]
MQFNLSTICLAAATLFASHILAAPAPAPVPNPVFYGGPSGHDEGNSVCFKSYFYGAASCPGRAYEDGTCCISDEIELKVPEPKAKAASTGDGAGAGGAE